MDIEDEIIAWHRDTFPNASMLARIKKIKEECVELFQSAEIGNIQQLLEEAADVFIVAVSIAADKSFFEENVSMTRVIADKMEINKGRIWGKEMPDGDRPRKK